MNNWILLHIYRFVARRKMQTDILLCIYVFVFWQMCLLLLCTTQCFLWNHSSKQQVKRTVYTKLCVASYKFYKQ